MSGAWSTVRDGTLAARDAALDLTNVETLRLAVTGLSRSGKTVFLVSLISNLLAMARGVDGQRLDTLPRLAKHLADEQGHSRLLKIEIESTGVQRIPRFAYESLRDGLARGDEPAWPPFTDRPAMLTLRMLVQPRPGLARAKGWLLGPRIVRLELLDYPGEWLVDLPMLDQSYEAWSQTALTALRETPRAAFAQEFLTFLETLRPGAPAVEEVAMHGFRLYREALRRCRDEAGLRWLQPGRFLMPGPWGDVPFLHFFPWTGAPAPMRGTLGAVLRDRFDAYRREVRETFFNPYFSAFNRQIVLVDVLGALFAGRAAFEDTRKALGSIGTSYARLLEGWWPPGLRIGGRRIGHVAFVATKADHVDDHQRDNLRLILREMVQSAPARGGRQSFHAISSVRCTTDADVPAADGRMSRVVVGVPLGESRRRPFSPGTVPSGVVPDSYWNHPYLVVPQLRPPAFQPGDAHPIEHLNLDEVLVAVLGDAL